MIKIMTGCRVRMGGSCGGGDEGPTPKPRRGVERKPVFVGRQEAWHSPGQMEEREPHGKRREKTRSDRRQKTRRTHEGKKTQLDTVGHWPDGKVCTRAKLPQHAGQDNILHDENISSALFLS